MYIYMRALCQYEAHLSIIYNLVRYLSQFNIKQLMMNVILRYDLLI